MGRGPWASRQWSCGESILEVCRCRAASGERLVGRRASTRSIEACLGKLGCAIQARGQRAGGQRKGNGAKLLGCFPSREELLKRVQELILEDETLCGGVCHWSGKCSQKNVGWSHIRCNKKTCNAWLKFNEDLLSSRWVLMRSGAWHNHGNSDRDMLSKYKRELVDRVRQSNGRCLSMSKLTCTLHAQCTCVTVCCNNWQQF